MRDPSTIQTDKENISPSTPSRNLQVLSPLSNDLIGLERVANVHVELNTKFKIHQY